jgi:hypothetical protein
MRTREENFSELHFNLIKIDFDFNEDLTPFIKDSRSKFIYKYEGSRSIQLVVELIPDIAYCRTFRRVRRTRYPGSTITRGEKFPAQANNPI